MKSIIESELFETGIYQKKYSVDFLTDELIENQINIDTKQENGLIKEIQLDGILMIMTDINAPRKYQLNIEANFPVFVLHFELSGTHKYTPDGYTKPLVRVSNYQYNISYLPTIKGISECQGTPQRTLKILFTLDQIKKIVGDNYGETLSKVDSAVKDGKPYAFWENSRPIPVELVKTLEELHGCRLCGQLKKVYLQTKVTSLMVDLLIQANEISNPSLKINLDKTELHSLQQVEHHIKTNLNKPLTIAELSTIAGFNESKLKRDFKLLYNSTIFKYITKLRMEKAVSLIKNEGHTISQAAYEVGYSHPQHFSKAFMRTFGYLPKMLKKITMLIGASEMGAVLLSI